MPERFESWHNKPEGFYRRPSLPEQLGRRIEDIKELELKPGDVVGSREARGRVDEVIWNVENPGGGRLRFGEFRADGSQRVVEMSFAHFLNAQDDIVEIIRFEDDDRSELRPKQLTVDEREQAEEAWKMFEQADLQPGDELYSKSGTKRVIKEVSYGWWHEGGSILLERHDSLSGEVKLQERPMRSYVEAMPDWIDRVDRQGKRGD